MSKAKSAKKPSSPKVKGASPKSAPGKAKAAKAGPASTKGAKSAASSKGGKAQAPAPSPKSGHDANSASNPKRKLGLRGAAPWAARHAAKHAAEARARAAEPAPPGSARATIRTPTGAEEIKAKIAELHTQTQKVRTLRKRLEKGFYEVGQVLTEIQQQELYQAKGYGSFEAFLEREIDLGKLTCLKLMKVPQIFQREAALDFGMDRLFAAISALEGELIPKAIPSAPGSKPALPLKPPSRLVG
ncbi:MAG: hypothetical protein U0414_05445 [Polyangiaceae bacterium]